MKYLLFFIFITMVLLASATVVLAYGECTKYGMMAYYDMGVCKCMSGYVFGTDFMGNTSCVSCFEKYGIGSTTDYINGGCMCMSGYVVKNDYAGKPKCVSADQECRNQYGVMSRYNSTYEKCECSYGYIFGIDSIGRTQCISEDEQCQNNYGYNSTYNSLSDKCECSYGYEFTLKNGGGLDCVRCSTKYGIHSSYNSLSKKCECDDGYTLDDNNQCVEKQNNVYFLLEVLDTDNDKAIIKSDYDHREYLVEYGVGCLSIENYVDNKIVVNLGTDFSLDTWDKIVLQNNDQTCNITYKELVFGTSDICDDGYILSDNKCTKITCPDNSTLIGKQCFCNSGYRMDSTGATCAKIEAVKVYVPPVAINQNNTSLNKNTVNQKAKSIEDKKVIQGKTNGANPPAAAVTSKPSIWNKISSSVKGFFSKIFK